MRTFALAVGSTVLVLASCGASLRRSKLNEEFGPEQVRNRVVPASAIEGVSYEKEVAPLLERRCVVCHACYDAPCQLKMGAPEGIFRGASKEKVYSSERLLAAAPTRLFEDAHSTELWRSKGFSPVLNEREDSVEANLDGSVLYQMLRLKRDHPLPRAHVLAGFDFAINRKQSCPTIEEFPEYEKKTPLGGMPYGLPGLTDDEFETVQKWLAEGAVVHERDALPKTLEKQVASWEALLNVDDAKSRLVGRYLYEHLFLGHIYFSDVSPQGEPPVYFELVRSRSKPGAPLKRISTRRPFSDPEVGRVYYRFELEKSPIVEKSHLPYALNEKRRLRFKHLFYDRKFEVTKLPGYEPQVAANPFASFQKIPVDSRYRFLLDDADFFIGGFIKGPVCHGQVALNVINDRFWIHFFDPDDASAHAEADFYSKEISLLDLPAEDQSNADILTNWLKFSTKQEKYLKSRSSFLEKRHGTARGVNLDIVWNGEGTNRSSALTVMRHEDSANVVQGLVGAPPKTSWVIGYGILERIHYLLVAGFDVYGNVGHQLNTRHYMDFLRMEAEMNFLSFLPKDARRALLNEWYEGAEDVAGKYMSGIGMAFLPNSSIVFSSMNPQMELYEMLQKRLGATYRTGYNVDALGESSASALAQSLADQLGGPVRYFPALSFLRVRTGEQSKYFTLVRDQAHTNITSLFNEKSNLVPEKDRLTFLHGLVGAYPNALFDVEEKALPEFRKALVALKSEKAYLEFRKQFGVLRSSDEFWAYADALHEHQSSKTPLFGRLFDFNRLENR